MIDYIVFFSLGILQKAITTVPSIVIALIIFEKIKKYL